MARRSGATYLSAGVLAGYSQLFGVVVVPAHLALAAAWWTLTPRWKEPSSKEHPRFPLQQFLPWGLGALLLTGLLYAPFLRSILRFVSERAGLPGEGPRIGIGLLHETLEGLGASLGGPVPLAVAGALGIVGTVVWCRRHFFAFLTVVAPILVQVPVFMALGAGVHPRYFAVALPAVYLVGALGCFAVTEAVACRLLRSQTGVRRVSAAAVALAVALSALPLRDYYRYPKQDFLGAMEYVQRSATPNDQVVGVGPTGRVLGDFYGVDLVTVDELRDLAPVEDRGRTVWVLVTLEGLLEASAAELMLHLRERYERVASFPGTVGDGAVRVYRKEAGIDG